MTDTGSYEKIPREESTITCVQDAVGIADKEGLVKSWATTLQHPIQSWGIWYRGESDNERHLHPSVFRPPPDEPEQVYDETNLFLHFQLRLPGALDSHASTIDWLSLMRHYELPTRLLDWSESILVALYFAVRNLKKANKYGVIFVLNARLLNEISDIEPTSQVGIHTPESFNAIIRAEMACHRTMQALLQQPILGSFYDLDTAFPPKLLKARNDNEFLEKLSKDEKLKNKLSMPVSLFPRRSHGRLVAQFGTFTLHGGKVHTEKPTLQGEPLPAPLNLETICFMQDTKKFLRAYKVAAEKKEDIKKQLESLGIHEGTLYPELDHQAAFVRNIWIVPRKK